jgi:riboflavin transporter FmnP
MISRFSAEIATATVTAGLGLIAVIGALEFGIGWGDAGPESGAFPFYMGLLILGASVGTMIQSVKGRLDLQEVFLDRVRAGRVASFLGPIVVFVIISMFLGLYVATALYLTYVMWRQGGYRLIVSAVSGVVAAIIFYLILEYAFQVPLMKGPLESALGLY